MTRLSRILVLLSFCRPSFVNIKAGRTVLFFGFLFALSACQSTGGVRQHAMKSQFNPNKATYVFSQGTGQITGQAFINVDGKVRYASGGRVSLVPATPYAQERMRAIYGTGSVASKPVRFVGQDPQYRTYARHHTANSQGEFIFRNVAAGDYFITTGIVWRTAGDPVTGKFRRVALKKRVRLGEGEKINVTLSGGS